MKTAVIVGCEGQDGRLLTSLLREKGYRTLGLGRTSVRAEGGDWPRPIDLTRPLDITRPDAVRALVAALRPDEIYHLAAIHHSSEEEHAEDLAAFRLMYEVNFFSLLNFLDAVRVASPGSRLFFAASSHVFGTPAREMQDEETPLRPESIYGMTKADGLLACRLHRERHGLFASTGILYTHESELRDEKFLSMKIVRAALRIKAGEQRELVLGRLDARIDWGFAGDYVDAMQRILAAPRAGEFVVATGAAHSVGEFAQVVFESLGLDWRRHVREDPALLTRPAPVRIGDPRRLRGATGWTPATGFDEMIRILLRAAGAAVPVR
jgi:GDPmannose 4,6-dehydratase